MHRRELSYRYYVLHLVLRPLLLRSRMNTSPNPYWILVVRSFAASASMTRQNRVLLVLVGIEACENLGSFGHSVRVWVWVWVSVMFCTGTWPLHDIVMTNIVWYIHHTHGRSEGGS